MKMSRTPCLAWIFGFALMMGVFPACFKGTEHVACFIESGCPDGYECRGVVDEKPGICCQKDDKNCPPVAAPGGTLAGGKGAEGLAIGGAKAGGTTSTQSRPTSGGNLTVTAGVTQGGGRIAGNADGIQSGGRIAGNVGGMQSGDRIAGNVGGMQSGGIQAGGIMSGGSISGTVGSPAGGSSDPGKGKNGDACIAGDACQSGYCVLQVCCDQACDKPCHACRLQLTGKADGICAPVGSGKKDPQNTCVDETSMNECGTDGFCDGTGTCRIIGTDHVCKPASCSGTTFTPTATCDGMGSCAPVKGINCESAQCDTSDGCRTSCATSADCVGNAFCNTVLGKCTAKKIDGDSCSHAADCLSGFCVDEVCCKTKCEEKCTACSSSLTGQASGSCQPVKNGTDPHDSCSPDAENECGDDGLCDGAGACRKIGTDRICLPPSCKDGSFVRAATCSGTGSCSEPTSEDCGAFLCSAIAGCQKTCADDKECTGKNYCDLVKKTCATKKSNGGACAGNTECASGFCIDGTCCNTDCTGTCKSCKAEHTGAANGTCASVSVGIDPYDSCTEEISDTNPCGNTGACNGSGGCQKEKKGQSCGQSKCTGNLFTPKGECDGKGTCPPAGEKDCGVYQCSVTSGCMTSCSANSDCAGNTFCDTASSPKICKPKKANGETCGTDGTVCATGKCVDGVCCESSTCTKCQACNLAGSKGTCAPVAKGAKDPRGVCVVSGTVCGENGTCNGNGACSQTPSGTECGTTCVGSTFTQKTCNGAGICSGTGKSCDNNLVCASASACKTSCTTNEDCANSDLLCAAGECVVVCIFDVETSKFDDVCVLGQ